LYGLQDAAFLGAVQTTGVCGDQDVRRAVASLAHQPLDQFVVLAGDQMYFDAGLLGEILQQRLDELLLAL
jgi:hypothetical protein